MQYFGGKYRIRKQISEYLMSIINDRVFVEPFCGGLNITSEMKNLPLIIASDYNKALIQMYRSILFGWEPPSELSEDEYNQIKENNDPNDPITAFAAFGCSFSGKWFGGYARSNRRNYALNAKNSLLRKFKTIRSSNIIFLYKSFFTWKSTGIQGVLFYCDPPYKDTTSYSGTPDFDNKLFWEHIRILSKKNIVIVSEYLAPDDFECVLEIPTRTEIRMSDGTKDYRIEKLFRIIE